MESAAAATTAHASELARQASETAEWITLAGGTVGTEPLWTVLIRRLGADAALVAAFTAQTGFAAIGEAGLDAQMLAAALPMLRIPSAESGVQAFAPGAGSEWVVSAYCNALLRKVASMGKDTGKRAKMSFGGETHGGVTADQISEVVESTLLGDIMGLVKSDMTTLKDVTDTLIPKVGVPFSMVQRVLIWGLSKYTTSKAVKAPKDGAVASDEKMWNDSIGRLQVFFSRKGGFILRKGSWRDGERKFSIQSADEAAKLVYRLELVTASTTKLYLFSSNEVVFRHQTAAGEMTQEDRTDATKGLCAMVRGFWGARAGDDLALQWGGWTKKYRHYDPQCSTWPGGAYGIEEKFPRQRFLRGIEKFKDEIEGGPVVTKTLTTFVSWKALSQKRPGATWKFDRHVEQLCALFKANELSVRRLASQGALMRGVFGDAEPEAEDVMDVDEPRKQKKRVRNRGKNQNGAVCNFWDGVNMTSCRNGAGCRFSHPPGTAGRLAGGAPGLKRPQPQGQHVQGACGRWDGKDPNSCPYGAKCRFRHDPGQVFKLDTAVRGPGAPQLTITRPCINCGKGGHSRSQCPEPNNFIAGLKAIEVASRKLMTQKGLDSACMHASWKTGGCRFTDEECALKSHRPPGSVKHAGPQLTDADAVAVLQTNGIKEMVRRAPGLKSIFTACAEATALANQW